MNSQLIPFNFDDSLIRSTVIDGKPWFIARDVATALGYTNPMEAVRYHCKGVSETLTPTSGGEQTVKIISKGDVLRLITRSRLPAAERFESWVFDEMLPELLSKGSYSLVDQAEKQRLESVKSGLRLRGEVERLIDKAKRERNPYLRATLHAALVDSCAAPCSAAR